MRKYLGTALIISIAVILISWGGAGHKTVATIAYNHLTPQARETVKRFLGNETMADVSSWADQVLRDSAYRNTASWHYLNLPLGLTYDDFKKNVLSQQKDNVYSALLKNERIFTAQNSTKAQRTVALKFIIHLIGDLHQPMHVSRAEDKGGNGIQLQYEGKGTNLHSLWDGKLIGTEGKTVDQMSVEYDNATSKEIRQWQKDDVLKWLFESYQISSRFYAEVEQNNKLDDNYYKEHISIVQQRIKMSGIRLAGVLNQLAKSMQLNTDVYVYGKITPVDNPVKPEFARFTPALENTSDITRHIGKPVSIIDIVADYKVIHEGLILLNLGKPYPNQTLTIALKGDQLKINPRDYKGKKVFVYGTAEMYNGKPEIVVTDSTNFQLFPKE